MTYLNFSCHFTFFTQKLIIISLTGCFDRSRNWCQKYNKHCFHPFVAAYCQRTCGRCSSKSVLFLFAKRTRNVSISLDRKRWCHITSFEYWIQNSTKSWEKATPCPTRKYKFQWAEMNKIFIFVLTNEKLFNQEVFRAKTRLHVLAWIGLVLNVFDWVVWLSTSFVIN